MLKVKGLHIICVVFSITNQKLVSVMPLLGECLLFQLIHSYFCVILNYRNSIQTHHLQSQYTSFSVGEVRKRERTEQTEQPTLWFMCLYTHTWNKKLWLAILQEIYCEISFISMNKYARNRQQCPQGFCYKQFILDINFKLESQISLSSASRQCIIHLTQQDEHHQCCKNHIKKFTPFQMVPGNVSQHYFRLLTVGYDQINRFSGTTEVLFQSAGLSQFATGSNE